MDEALDYVRATLTVLSICPDNYLRIEAAQYGTWANVAMSLNQPELAREKGLQSLRINQDIYATDRITTSQYVAAFSELGRIMVMDNEFEEAERLIKESERLRRQMPDFTRLQLFSPTVFYSYIEVVRGQFKAAEEHLVEALGHREKKYGKDDRESKRYAVDPKE